MSTVHLHFCPFHVTNCKKKRWNIKAVHSQNVLISSYKNDFKIFLPQTMSASFTLKLADAHPSRSHSMNHCISHRSPRYDDMCYLWITIIEHSSPSMPWSWPYALSLSLSLHSVALFHSQRKIKGFPVPYWIAIFLDRPIKRLFVPIVRLHIVRSPRITNHQHISFPAPFAVFIPNYIRIVQWDRTLRDSHSLSLFVGPEILFEIIQNAVQ